MAKKARLVHVSTSRLKNESHFRYHMENEKLYRMHEPNVLGINMFMSDYQRVLADEDAALERCRKSSDTKHITAADKLFDETFTSLRLQVQSYLKNPRKDYSKAAEKLYVIIQQYGNLNRKEHSDQLASSDNLIQDLRKRADDVAKLKIDMFINDHAQAQDNLATLLEIRDFEVASQTKLRVIDTRRAVDEVHQKIIDQIEAMMVIKGPTYAPEFIDIFNVHGNRYKRMLAVHQGRIQKKTESVPSV